MCFIEVKFGDLAGILIVPGVAMPFLSKVVSSNSLTCTLTCGGTPSCRKNNQRSNNGHCKDFGST